jgi:RNA polymerase sigma-70 factor (ECF subfamily)
MDAKNDSDLIGLALEGNQDAGDILFLRYYSKISSYFKARVWDQEVVQDLAQETFFRAWKKLPQVRESFGGWLHKIARSVLMDFFRSGFCHPSFSSLTHEFDREDSQQLSLEARILMRENIQEAFERLPPLQQRCLELTIVEGLTPSEIARQLKLKESTVKTYVSHGRKVLRNAIFHSEMK